jgi:hypothetical protein
MDQEDTMMKGFWKHKDCTDTAMYVLRKQLKTLSTKVLGEIWRLDSRGFPVEVILGPKWYVIEKPQYHDWIPLDLDP